MRYSYPSSIREGVVAGIGPFIDTIIICTMSAMVLLMTGAWNRPALGTVEFVEGDAVRVRCTTELPANFQRTYMAAIDTGDNHTLAIHLEHEKGKEPKTLVLPISAIFLITADPL